MTSASSLFPMIDDLEVQYSHLVTLILMMRIKRLATSHQTSVDGSEGPVGGTVDADGKPIEFDTSDHSKSATVQGNSRCLLLRF